MRNQSIRRRNNWFNLSEARNELGCSDAILKQLRPLYPFDKTTGKLGCWSAGVIERMRLELQSWTKPGIKSQAQVRKENGWYNTAEAAKYLGIADTTLKRTWAKSVPPSNYVGIHAVWTKDDLDKMFTIMKPQSDPQYRYQVIYDSGYISVAEACRQYGIPVITWASFFKRKKIPKPTHDRGIKTMRFYSLVEAKRYAKVINASRAKHKGGRPRTGEK